MYVDRLVEGDSGERLCLASRPHWFRIAKHGLLGVTLIVVGLVLVLFGEQLQRLLAMFAPQFMVTPDGPGTAAPAFAVPVIGARLSLDGVVVWGALTVSLAGVLLLGWALLNRHFTEYAITMSPNFGGRIIKVEGVLSRQTVSVPLDMVNNLVLYEPLLGRILGWGDIDIETGNDYGRDRLKYMPNPRAFDTVWKTLLNNGYAGHRRSTGHFIADPDLNADPASDLVSPSVGPGRRLSVIPPISARRKH